MIIMKTKLLSLCILFLIVLLPACRQQDSSSSASGTFPKIAVKLEDFGDEYSVFNKVCYEDKYIFITKKGIYIQKTLDSKSQPLVKARKIKSALANEKYVIYTVVEGENSGSKIGKTTTLFCVNTDTGNQTEIASLNNCDLRLLGFFNGSIYLTGHKDTDSDGDNIYSYPLDRSKLILLRENTLGAFIKSGKVYYNTYFDGEVNVPLYSLDLRKAGAKDDKILDSALCESYSSSDSSANFWTYDVRDGSQPTWNYDHYIYTVSSNLTERSVQFPDKTILHTVLDTKRHALVYCGDKSLSRKGLYLWNFKTGAKKFISEKPLQTGCERGINSENVYFIVKGSGSLSDAKSSDSHLYMYRDSKLFELKIKGKTPDFSKGYIVEDKWVKIKKTKIKTYDLVSVEQETQPATEKTSDNKSSDTQSFTEANFDSVADNAPIVVIDAGHDTDVHTRNHPDLGFNEQDLNLKIAKACYNRLTEYKGIKVYMTRTDGRCPDAETKYGDCITARTKFADKMRAGLFVSLHCNATSGKLGASASGTEVYVSKHPDFYTDSKKLGEIILGKITSSLDMKSRGVLTRSKPSKGTYEDGTVKDFYYLISNNIDVGRPSVIIEHAFMDNIHDNKILKNDDNLKKFGVADADAIAQYYGLEKK